MPYVRALHTRAKDERVYHTCRGVLPAVSGQFVSHGLRTFAFEGSLTGLKALSGGAAELQVGLPDTCVNFSAWLRSCLALMYASSCTRWVCSSGCLAI